MNAHAHTPGASRGIPWGDGGRGGGWRGGTPDGGRRSPSSPIQQQQRPVVIGKYISTDRPGAAGGRGGWQVGRVKYALPGQKAPRLFMHFIAFSAPMRCDVVRCTKFGGASSRAHSSASRAPPPPAPSSSGPSSLARCSAISACISSPSTAARVYQVIVTNHPGVRATPPRPPTRP